MISSRFGRRSRAGVSPSSAAARSMFARPVYSGWKPEPSSSSAPTRPLTTTVPRVGLITAGDDLEQRRLAGAVLADDAERLAARELGTTRRRMRERHAPRRVRADRSQHETHAAAARTRLSRSPCRRCRARAGRSDPQRRAALGDAARSDEVLEVRRQPAEHRAPCRRTAPRRPAAATPSSDRKRCRPSSSACAQSIDQPAERIRRDVRTQLFGHRVSADRESASGT